MQYSNHIHSPVLALCFLTFFYGPSCHSHAVAPTVSETFKYDSYPPRTSSGKYLSYNQFTNPENPNAQNYFHTDAATLSSPTNIFFDNTDKTATDNKNNNNGISLLPDKRLASAKELSTPSSTYNATSVINILPLETDGNIKPVTIKPRYRRDGYRNREPEPSLSDERGNNNNGRRRDIPRGDEPKPPFPDERDMPNNNNGRRRDIPRGSERKPPLSDERDIDNNGRGRNIPRDNVPRPRIMTTRDRENGRSNQNDGRNSRPKPIVVPVKEDQENQVRNQRDYVEEHVGRSSERKPRQRNPHYQKNGIPDKYQETGHINDRSDPEIPERNRYRKIVDISESYEKIPYRDRRGEDSRVRHRFSRSWERRTRIDKRYDGRYFPGDRWGCRPRRFCHRVPCFRRC